MRSLLADAMSMRSLLASVASLACLSCVTGVEPERLWNPVPSIERIDPPALTVSEEAPTVVLVGRDFVEGAYATWNGTTRTTELESSTRLRVTLEAQDAVRPGVGALAVVNPGPGGGSSAERALEIGNPAPRVDSIRPTSVEALSAPSVTLRVFGEGFTSFGTGSIAVLGEPALVTDFVTEAEVRVTIGEHLLRLGRSWSLVVVNPAPGGGDSDPVDFDVRNPLPSVSAVDPDSIRLHSPAEVRLSGAGFVPGMVAWVDSASFEATTLSPDSLVFDIPEVGPARTGRIRVESPGPGGGLSNEITVGIQEARPLLRATTPLALEHGVPTTLRVRGDRFAPDAVVSLDGVPRPTTFVSPQILEIEATASDVDSVRAFELEVTNPRGGGPSGPLQRAVVPRGRIAYAWIFGGAFITSRLNGTDRMDITSVTEPWASWIDTWPSGRGLVYTRAYGGIDRPGLFRITPGGTELVISDANAEWPRLTSDAEWVYFGLSGGIWRIRPDGTDQESVIAASPDFGSEYPEPSPTGDRLLYSHRHLVSPYTRDLRILDLGDGTVTSLSVEGQDARWSPDGQWIAYRDTWDRLRLVRPDGSGERPAPGSFSTRLGSGSFDWSPDSRYLLAIYGGELHLLDLAAERVLRIPRVPCGDCPWAEYKDAWRLSWYANPAAG